MKKNVERKNLSSVGNRTELLKICADNKLTPTKKVNEKERDKSTSVYHFLGTCNDFKNEKGQMEYKLEEKFKVELRMTLECHPEIAGQEIEYVWGYAKLRFCQHFNDITAANLEKNVCAALSTSVITQERVNKFILLLEQMEAASSRLKKGKEMTSHAQHKIEQTITLFKQHRSALDSDYAFIKNA